MNLDVNYSPERAVSERDHGHSRDQQQERDQGCDRDVLRSGHRREFDARYPRRSLSDQVEGVVRDVGTFRTVALVDIANRQFDGHPFAARQGIAQAEQQDWIVRQQAQGPTGRPYTLLVARARGVAAASAAAEAAVGSTRCSSCEAVAGGRRADDDGRGARGVGAVARTRAPAAVWASPVRIGSRTVRWVEQAVLDFIATRPRADSERPTL